MFDRCELVDFIIDRRTQLEGLDCQQRYEELCKMGFMSYEELENEVKKLKPTIK
ncbi:hypothetical protein KPL47_06815 [Clostridium estertheticum]|uniref:hypothetical protein n=1 Tax=Clostridium estertheticum TaxID=238834 RepID=UPI001C0D0BFC|nr:hypothetical protein [Clostridium estertheticum]MBU3176078.1 hypothetical protein [Clostridium estertheticum]